MKKNLLVLTCVLLSFCSYSQVTSIRPNYAVKGQTLQTIITTALGVLSQSSGPTGSSDIYLQQGSTIIPVNSFDPAINIYPSGNPWGSPYTDSMYVDFTIPLSVPSGSYDVHVVTYYGPIPQWPIDNLLSSGFTIMGNAGNISGNVFFDFNQNGVKDGTDYNLANHIINVAPGNFTLYTDPNGNYSAIVDTGTYTITPDLTLGYTITTPNPSYNVTIPPSSTGNDFGIFNSAVLTDQYFSVWHHPMRCQPSRGYTYITQKNNGNITVQGSITLVHSSNMSFNTSNPLPDVISGDTLIWYYNNLAPGATLVIGDNPWISFNDPPAGQTIWYSVFDSVFDPGNNFIGELRDTFSFEVTCSCDPNEKIVTPIGATSQHYVPMEHMLNYTVNFQNTGNDTAFTVVIIDTLDSDLDLTTFKILGSSDPVSTQIRPNGEIQFVFNTILLPDSNVDEPNSHGFVNYRISPKSGLPDPTRITNTAYIFFDANPAVVTNTAFSTLTNLEYPSASFNVIDPTICQNNCISFSDLSTSGTSYAWTFQGGNPATSSSSNPGAVCYSNVGQYNVQLIVTNALGSDTLLQSQYIDVSAAPTGLTFYQAGDTLWANSGYYSYQWFYENDSIQGANGQYYIAPVSGDYGIIVGNANGCTAGLNIPNVISAVGELIDSRGATLFPNPTTGAFEISFTAFGKSNAKIEVINTVGQIVSSKSVQINSGFNKISFEENELTDGIYSVRITNENQTITRQLLKIK